MKKFFRQKSDSKVFGVCSGLAKYTDTDPAIWRLLFIFLVFSPVPIILLYVVATIITPSE